MGGRSREPRQQTDSWDWLTQLTSDRLENYGRYSSIEIQSILSVNQNVSTGSAGNLNLHAAKEYERRNGFLPDWKQ